MKPRVRTSLNAAESSRRVKNRKLIAEWLKGLYRQSAGDINLFYSENRKGILRVFHNKIKYWPDGHDSLLYSAQEYPMPKSKDEILKIVQ